MTTNLQRSVTDLELSVRTTNILLQNGVETVADIIRAGKVRIATFQHFGNRQMQELEDVLLAHNLHLPSGLTKTEEN